jgi:hypothetical protein
LAGNLIARRTDRVNAQRIGRLKDSGAAGRFDRLHPLAASLLAASNDGDARAEGGERVGHRAPKSACAADDRGDFAIKLENVREHRRKPSAWEKVAKYREQAKAATRRMASNIEETIFIVDMPRGAN